MRALVISGVGQCCRLGGPNVAVKCSRQVNEAMFYVAVGGGSDSFMMMMVGWMLMAVMMYFLRPSSMRNNSLEGKPRGKHQTIALNF